MDLISVYQYLKFKLFFLIQNRNNCENEIWKEEKYVKRLSEKIYNEEI